MGSTQCGQRRAAHRPATFTGSLLSLLLGGYLLLILGAAVPGGADTGPAFPAIGTPPAPAAAGEPPGAGLLAAPDLFAGDCGEDERPREREGVGRIQVRLRCTVSDTRLLKTPDDLTQRCPGDRTAGAPVLPRGPDGRPRLSRARESGDTTALLQVFRC